MQNIKAEVRLPTAELRDDIPFFTETLGMRMEKILPADDPRVAVFSDPRVAVFSGHGLRVRIETGAPEPPGTLRILADDPVLIAGGARQLVAPNGTRIEVAELDPPLVLPPTEHAFVVRRLADAAPWVIGRAGMHYRDLVPTRLGGASIASRIRIPDGGPVPDMVHFHKVGFQLNFCIRGWVDVVYEDQGGPRRLHAGDCFIQPPEIRHRVLEASDGVEVVEIGVPAEHVTEIEHAMTLPTPVARPDREWEGQRFVHNRGGDGAWGPFRIPGLICRDTTIAGDTGGVAGVQVVRRGQGECPPTRHDADILFGFVIAGAMTLEGEGASTSALGPGDAFVIPPGMVTRYNVPSQDLELLEVALPGQFATEIA